MALTATTKAQLARLSAALQEMTTLAGYAALDPKVQQAMLTALAASAVEASWLAYDRPVAE